MKDQKLTSKMMWSGLIIGVICLALVLFIYLIYRFAFVKDLKTKFQDDVTETGYSLKNETITLTNNMQPKATIAPAAIPAARTAIFDDFNTALAAFNTAMATNITDTLALTVTDQEKYKHFNGLLAVARKAVEDSVVASIALHFAISP